MDIFNYDRQTGAFVGMSKADKSPLDEEWLIPAFATKTPPPDTPDGHVAVFRDGEWVVLRDTLGQEYWLDGVRYRITEYGAELPEGASLTPPPSPPRRVGTPREFLRLFSEEERLAFFAAAQSSAELQLWWAEASTGEFSLDHPSVATGLSVLVGAGVLTIDRSGAIQGADFDA